MTVRTPCADLDHKSMPEQVENARGDIAAYLEQPYHFTLTRDHWEDGTNGWLAEVQELPGCMSQGTTAIEALERLADAMYSWIEVGLEEGREIPPPRDEPSYSGKFLLRIPKSLHADLARRAEEEGVSLNTYAATALAFVVGGHYEAVRIGDHLGAHVRS